MWLGISLSEFPNPVQEYTLDRPRMRFIRLRCICYYYVLRDRAPRPVRNGFRFYLNLHAHPEENTID